MLRLFRAFAALVFIGFVVPMSLSGCTAYDLGDEKPAIIEVDTNNPTWEYDMVPVLSRRCDNCHSTEERPFAPADAKPFKVGFATLGEATFKKKWAALSLARVKDGATRPMPPNYADPLTTDERTALLTYLKKATATVAGATPAGCTATSTTLTFDGIKSFTSTACASCHVNTAPRGGGVALETAAQFKTHRIAAIEYLTGQRATVMPPGLPEFAQSDNGKKLIEWLCASSEVK